MNTDKHGLFCENIMEQIIGSAMEVLMIMEESCCIKNISVHRCPSVVLNYA